MFFSPSLLGLDGAEQDGDEEISKLLLPKRIKTESNHEILDPSNDGKFSN